MVELFQITGSCSFAARAALEEAGVDYTVIDVHPRRRDETPGFYEANPLARVPTLREDDVTVYETGAVLLWSAERFPEARLAPPVGSPRHAEYLRWVTWLANTLHGAWTPLQVPQFLADDPGAHDSIAKKGRENLDRYGEYLEGQLRGRPYCVGDQFTVADVYLYMLTGWQHYVPDGYVLGGAAVQEHFERVGARPAITRTRELDDLDERFIRQHPDMRGGTLV